MKCIALFALAGVLTTTHAQQPPAAAGNVDAQSVVSHGPTPSPALLVGEKSGGRLAIIDPKTLEVVARVPAGGNLHEVATDGKYAYLGSRLPGITVVDVEAQHREAPIDTGALGSFHALYVAGGKLYVGHEQGRLLSRYDPATHKFDLTLGLPGGSHMLYVTPDEQRIFTASSNGQLVSIIDASTVGRSGRVEWAFTNFPGDTRMEGMDLSPDGREFWAINMNQKTITVIDVPDRKVVATLAFEGGLNNRIKFTLDGKYVLMNELNGNELLVWDVAAREIVKRIDVGAGGEGIFIDPNGKRAYYAVSRGNKLAVIDLATFTVIKEIPDLVNPDGMAWYVRR